MLWKKGSWHGIWPKIFYIRNFSSIKTEPLLWTRCHHLHMMHSGYERLQINERLLIKQTIHGVSVGWQYFPFINPLKHWQNVSPTQTTVYSNGNSQRLSTFQEIFPRLCAQTMSTAVRHKKIEERGQFHFSSSLFPHWTTLPLINIIYESSLSIWPGFPSSASIRVSLCFIFHQSNSYSILKSSMLLSNSFGNFLFSDFNNNLLTHNMKIILETRNHGQVHTYNSNYLW